jgi:hypothetical protein
MTSSYAMCMSKKNTLSASQDPKLVKRPGPLYAFPFMFMAKGAAPALGIARHAVDG